MSRRVASRQVLADEENNLVQVPATPLNRKSTFARLATSPLVKMATSPLRLFGKSPTGPSTVSNKQLTIIASILVVIAGLALQEIANPTISDEAALSSDLPLPNSTKIELKDLPSSKLARFFATVHQYVEKTWPATHTRPMSEVLSAPNITKLACNFEKSTPFEDRFTCIITASSAKFGRVERVVECFAPLKTCNVIADLEWLFQEDDFKEIAERVEARHKADLKKAEEKEKTAMGKND